MGSGMGAGFGCQEQCQDSATMRKGFGCKAVCGLVPSWVQGSDAGLGACLAPELP